MGDPAGIGPEIIIKSLAFKETYNKCNPVVIGDASIMEYAVKQCNISLSINAIDDIKDAIFTYGTIDVYDLKCINMDTFKQGKVDAQCGNAAFLAVKRPLNLLWQISLTAL